MDHLDDEKLKDFYSLIEQKSDESQYDPSWNSCDQIKRLLKPGSAYLNLNPFEVLKIPYDASVDLIKRRYKKLSVLVHPDKNSNDQERAQTAFEAVNRSYKQLMDAKEPYDDLWCIQLEQSIKEKRMKIKRETRCRGLPLIPEDDSDKYAKALRAVVCKLFMDLERLRVRDEMKKNEERKRKADQRAADEIATAEKKEWDKNYEESRDSRVSNWQNFQKRKNRKKAKIDEFRPPKPEKK